mmetsp:Transcript_130065/g.277813  ORF Transcript_130065/g.277813 Transcript_130065/m.277813 type:complete len:244 (+) Transcript_130065:273-1004(+)
MRSIRLEALKVRRRHSDNLVRVEVPELLAMEEVVELLGDIGAEKVREGEATICVAARVHREVEEIEAPHETGAVDLPHQLPLCILASDVSDHHGRMSAKAASHFRELACSLHLSRALQLLVILLIAILIAALFRHRGGIARLTTCSQIQWRRRGFLLLRVQLHGLLLLWTSDTSLLLPLHALTAPFHDAVGPLSLHLEWNYPLVLVIVLVLGRKLKERVLNMSSSGQLWNKKAVAGGRHHVGE